MLWMVTIMTKVRPYLGICVGWQRKTPETPVTYLVACISAVIQIGHFHITCYGRTYILVMKIVSHKTDEVIKYVSILMALISERSCT